MIGGGGGGGGCFSVQRYSPNRYYLESGSQDHIPLHADLDPLRGGGGGGGREGGFQPPPPAYGHVRV